jgi:putative PIN family toxin of toxin-antitoxin system
VKTVFDTNVLVAAFLTEGICSKLLVRARKRDFDLVLCADIIKEFESILRSKFGVTRSDLSDVRVVVSEAASEIHQKIDPIKSVCRDPDDDIILACAHQAGADYIVTGDEDLLVLKRYNNIQILRPRDFELLFPD